MKSENEDVTVIDKYGRFGTNLTGILRNAVEKNRDF